jgi:hypothetical protein
MEATEKVTFSTKSQRNNEGLKGVIFNEVVLFQWLSQYASLFRVILRQHVHLIARYEVNILPRLTQNIHRILDLLFSFICLKTHEMELKYYM